MIRIEGLVKRFKEVVALNGLDLHVDPGAVYGFLGPNGAGKTTTLRILSGLARADGGQAWIADEPVGLHHLRGRQAIGILPEEPSFYPWMTAREYLCDFVAPLYGIDSRDARVRSNQTLEQVGLTQAAGRRIGGFSRGMRQRLGLAQALIHQPRVLLLDEPVSALDPSGRKDILDLIENLRGKITILLSTHILADVERVCDMIGIINQGKMLIEEPRMHLLERYARPTIVVEARMGLESWLEIARKAPFVQEVEIHNTSARLQVDALEDAQRALIALLAEQRLTVERFEVVKPSLEDVFIRLTDGSMQDSSENTSRKAEDAGNIIA